MVKRCGVRGWSCGRVCGRVLSCDLHTCEKRCHKSKCVSVFLSVHMCLLPLSLAHFTMYPCFFSPSISPLSPLHFPSTSSISFSSNLSSLPGDCSPCDQVISQRCQCGRESQPRPCAAPDWQCSQVSLSTVKVAAIVTIMIIS